jgi:hypothetical protein
MTNHFTFRRSGTCGHELLDPDGQVFAWTIDVASAAAIVAALNWAGFSRSAPAHQATGGCGPVEVSRNHGDRWAEADNCRGE